LMLDLMHYLPAKKKSTASGWISFNAPCCHHRGESADRRLRGGVKISDQGWSYHCFNCGYTASFVLGRTLTFKARQLLIWLNVPSDVIERVNLESMRHRSVQGLLESSKPDTANESVTFDARRLPLGFELVDSHAHPEHWQYLRRRAVPMDYPVGMTPDSARPGVIIPFTHQDEIVGSCQRFLDNRNPRYIHDIPSGYVFGADLQKPEWQHVLVMEGVFDALSVSGMAVLHADINDRQAQLIRGLGKNITVIPDRDTAGVKLIDRALELGWAVSFPEWPSHCKDVNDAVQEFGVLVTVLTIMHSRETSRIKIEMAKKRWQKNLKTTQ
jgi:hypothetical protein